MLPPELMKGDVPPDTPPTTRQKGARPVKPDAGLLHAIAMRPLQAAKSRLVLCGSSTEPVIPHAFRILSLAVSLISNKPA